VWGAYAPVMVEVRSAVPTDVAGVVGLHARVAAEGRWIATEVPVDSERFARVFADAIESDDSMLFVAVDEDSVVGNLGVHPSTPGVLGVGMSIDLAYRGQGIGTALLSAAVAWAHSQDGVHKLELEVWPHNAAGLALYTKVGFAIEGRRRRQYRRRNGELWDAVVMGLVLDHTSPGSPYPDQARDDGRAPELVD
jgi:RimJ/RimL family protein N-acetyltransferase